MTDFQLLDAKALAEKISVSKRQIFRLNGSGKIPAPLKIGGSLRWDAEEIAAWKDAGCPDRKVWQELKKAVAV